MFRATSTSTLGFGPPQGIGNQEMSNVQRWRSGRRGALRALVVLTFLLPGCGDDPVQADPAVAPFVGDWDAAALVVTSVANPDVHPDLIELGASFTLNVQASGQYTAILIFMGQASTEIGQIEVSGSTITLRRDFPTSSVSTATFAFQGSDRVTLDGDSEFDFNLDGTNEPARIHMEFVRQD